MLFKHVPPVILIFAIWFAGLGAAAQFSKITIIFNELSTYYGQSGVRSGFLLSTVSLLGVAFGLYAGVLGAKIGNRSLLIFGLFLGAITSFIQVSLVPFWGMIALRAIEGISHLAITVAAPTLIASYATDRLRNYAMTLWGSFFGVAFAIMSFISPALLSNGGLENIFRFHAIYMAVMGVLLICCLPDPRAGLAVAASAVPRTDTNFFTAHIKAYKSPFISAPAIGWVFYTLTFVSMIAVLPQFIAEEKRLFMIGAMPMTSIVSSMTFGVFLLRMFSAVKVAMTGFATALIIACIMFVTSVTVPLVIALYAGLGLIQGATFASVPELNDDIEDRSKANGLLVQTGNLGNLLGTPLLVFAIGISGQKGMLLVAAISYITALVAHSFLAGKRQKLKTFGASL